MCRICAVYVPYCACEYVPYPHARYGRVDLSSALMFHDSGFQTVYLDRQIATTTGTVKTWCLQVGASHASNVGNPATTPDFRVSLVWTGDVCLLKPR